VRSPEIRVLIIGTHSGQDRAAIDFARLESEFPGIIAGHFEVDSATGAGIGELRDAIAREAAGLPHANLPVTGEWTAARREILQAARETPFIHFDDFTQICQRYEIPLQDADDLARLMHDTGQLAYFSGDKELRDLVVLNPQRLTEAVGLVLTDQPTVAAGGVLDHTRLRLIWGDEERYPVSHHPYFLKVMEEFSLSYRIEDDGDRSLVPQLVPADQPDLPWDFGTPVADGKRALRLRCHLSEPVTGLIALLTARLRRMSAGRHWRSGVFLRHQRQDYNSEGLIVLLGDRALCLEVRAPVPDLLFHVLIDSVEELLRERWPGLGYTLVIPCTGVGPDGARCNAEFKLETLNRRLAQGRATITCPECDAKLSVGKLLTGFSGATAAIRAADDHGSGLINVGSLARQLSLLPEILAEQQRLEHRMTFVADSMHALLGAVNQEVTDCPRLFTLEPVNPHGLRKLEIHKRHFDLMLWCEYPDGVHPLTGHAYYVGEPKEWFEKIRPYLKVTLQLLRIAAPAAGVAAGLLAPRSENMQVGDSFKAMGELLERSEMMAGAVLDKAVDDSEAEPAEQVDELAQDSPDGQDAGLTAAEGAALRAFRELLFKLDPYRNFGGLGRALSSTGNYLWLCPEHFHVYHPGLPSLAADTVPPGDTIPPGDTLLPGGTLPPGAIPPGTNRPLPAQPVFTPAQR
jgi:hypothetical protein